MFGLVIDNALRATHFPCSKKHLYQSVKVAMDVVIYTEKKKLFKRLHLKRMPPSYN